MKKNQGFKGFETWWTSTRMHLKMYLYIGFAMLVAQVLVTFIFSYLWYSDVWYEWINYTWWAFSNWEWNYITSVAIPYAGWLLKQSLWIFALSLVIWIFYPAIIGIFKVRAKEQAADKHVRGARLLETEQLKYLIRKDDERVDIPLGQIKMPVSAEPKHVFVIGRPGVGKTVAISGVLARLREKNAKGVIYDFKGDYFSKFYDPRKDFLFNPLDTRNQGWNLFNEISNRTDVDSVATSLIPAASASDPFWNDAARDVFCGILHYLHQNNAKTNADIWNAVTAPKEKIAGWLSKTKGGERGYRYIEDASSKQALSVFAVMMQYTKSFEYMAAADGVFSIKKWLDDDNKGGFIFITSYADIQDTLKPILSLFVDLLGRKLLSMVDDYKRRVFFMLDEFGTLQKLSTITNLLTLSRSKGGSCWIGIQDIGQIDKIYGSELRQTIINACGSNLIFSVADPVTAKFLSEKIGEREYERIRETYSMGVEDNRDGISLSKEQRIDKLMLPNEIESLRDLTAILKLPNYDPCQIKLKYRHYKDLHTPFACREDLNLAHIVKKQADKVEMAEGKIEDVFTSQESQESTES